MTEPQLTGIRTTWVKCLLPVHWIASALNHKRKKCFLVKESNQNASILILSLWKMLEFYYLLRQSAWMHYEGCDEHRFQAFEIQSQVPPLSICLPAYTQKMQNGCNSGKCHNKKQGTAHHHVESHLVVYVAVNNKNLFNAILETILTTGY